MTTERSQLFSPSLLNGQVALVTGGGSGLGRETALELARCGARVVICGRREDPLLETVALDQRKLIEAHACDVREEDEVEAMVDEILARHGRIDLAVNNAGGQFLAPAESITPKGFRTVIRLNVEGTCFGIRLLALAAGQFETQTLLTKYPQAIVDRIADTIPLGRLGTEREFAWLVAYLASPDGDLFSGSVITMDGARDDWLGPWPPPQAADAQGTPLSEERRS